LIDVLFIIITAGFCKIDDVEEIWEWAKIEENTQWLRKYVALKNGIPSVATIRRILNTIEPKQFEKCFILWVSKLTVFSKDIKDTVAIDGKTMRGSRDGEKVTHIVNAWCSANNLVLGQVKTSAKSNEITAIPELLDLLYIEGCVVTMDAMGCQRKIVDKIIKKKADYVISLKDNQETLHDEVKTYFDDLKEAGELKKIDEGKSENENIKQLKTVDKGHGRIEVREYTYSTDIDWMINAKKDWKGLSGIGMVRRKVTEKGKVTEEIQEYIGSVKSVDEFAKAVREHWRVESMHWHLDITFKDDKSKIRKDLAPENMAVAKRIALNMVRNEREIYPDKSANRKRLIATLDLDYRTKVFDVNFMK
jgi:predicted transposase YbfD/YdcC